MAHAKSRPVKRNSPRRAGLRPKQIKAKPFDFEEIPTAEDIYTFLSTDMLACIVDARRAKAATAKDHARYDRCTKMINLLCTAFLMGQGQLKTSK